MSSPHAFGTARWYHGTDDLRSLYATDIANADIVIVCSCIPNSAAISSFISSIAQGIRVFFDVDSAQTFDDLGSDDGFIIDRATIASFDLYLAYSSGQILQILKNTYGVSDVFPMVYAADPSPSSFTKSESVFDMGYLGNYSDSKFYTLNRLMIEPAKCWKNGRFVVAGENYPDWIEWPGNITLINSVENADNAEFFTSLRYYLNITRLDTIRTIYSPQPSLFNAAAYGTTIISDFWEGLDTLFHPGSELLVARSTADILKYLRDTPESIRIDIGSRARNRVLAQHTTAQRVAELETCFFDILQRNGVSHHHSYNHHGKSM